MMTENNYYEILEISPTANQHDILVAYHKAKATYSPSNEQIKQSFTESEINDLSQLVEEAFGVLSNQEFRQIYEQQLNSKSYSEANMSFGILKGIVSESVSRPIEKIIQYPFSLKEYQIQENKSNLVAIDENFEKEISEQEQWTGEFLKKVREYKQVSISDLHLKTKVNPWYINAIESCDIANLPAAVFVRGYIVQIAKDLGLDSKKVADSYMKIYKSKSDSKS